MRKSTVVVLMLVMSLTGCLTVASDCPKPGQISQETQAQAAAELDALPPGSALGKVLATSLDDRDKLRACNKIR